MKTSVIIAVASILLFSVILYEGYKYYAEKTVELACAETERALEDKSRSFLLERTNELSSYFDLPPLSSADGGRIGGRLGAMRLKANKLTGLDVAAKLSEAELLYAVIGGYVDGFDKCVLFDNMIRMGQANAVSMYTADYLRAASNVSDGRIAELGQREYALLSESSRPAREDCKISAGRVAFSGAKGEEYCRALVSLNRGLSESITASLKETRDGHSLLYKAILANCARSCEYSETSCIADCWFAKKAVFE